MKADGMAVEKIVKYTGLTAQEIETLLSLDMDKKEYFMGATPTVVRFRSLFSSSRSQFVSEI